MDDDDLMKRLEAAYAEAALLAADPSRLAPDAPTLSGWRAVRFDGALVLTGRVRGHPYVIDDRTIVTSLLIAIGPDESWARTLSRSYRLLAPAGPGERGH